MDYRDISLYSNYSNYSSYSNFSNYIDGTMAIFSGHVCPPETWRGRKGVRSQVAERGERWDWSRQLLEKTGGEGRGRTTILTSIKGYRMLLLEVMCYFKNHSAIVS